MNKYLAIVVICIIASASASHYGGQRAGLVNAADLGYLQLPSIRQNLNYGGIPNVVEPSLIIPNIIAPSHGYGIQRIAAPVIQNIGVGGYGAHNIAPINRGILSPAGYAAHSAVPAVAQIGHLAGGAYGSQHAIKHVPRVAPVLVQAVSHTAGVPASSASSSSRSSKIQHIGAIHGAIHGANHGVHGAY